MTSSKHVQRALRDSGLADTSVEAVHRAAYSSDASLYRVTPLCVAFPRSSEEVITAVEVARDLGVALTARGAGTSVAGNAVGPGIVLDTSRHLDQILDIDPETRLARVQPGVVQDALQRAAAPHGLRFGPDPSTSTRCTIGGMIGNDACGSRSLGYGRTADNVEALTLVTGTGELLHTDRTLGDRGFENGRATLTGIIEGNLAMLRTELGRFGRQVSGYPLHQLLPENGRDLTRALVGTEGTLGVITEATVRLVTDPRHRVLVVLGYSDMVTAATDVPALLPHRPTACEGLDSRIVDVVASRRGRVPDLPRGGAWLFVEVSGDDLPGLLARADSVCATASTTSTRVVQEPGEAAQLWSIRADGAGLAGRAPSGLPAWPGWEDAAVPPERLAEYLQEFEELLLDHDLTAMPFGHFGDGCVHVRLDFPLGAPNARDRLTRFLTEAAVLVGRHGGSLSGEHGDGRARSALLSHMYSPTALEAFGHVKRVFDPDGVLNPGVLVDPAPLDADLRLPNRGPRTTLALAYPDDGGSFSQAVHRCTGVGKCRVTTQSADSVMCPSYAATRNEKDSTRGRARVLQEMLDGGLPGGWRDQAVHEALDLCLACKGCASDCPTGIDMASYKSEVLHQTYRRRLRPRSHYTLGWLPRWANLAQHFPRLANALAGSRLTRKVALWSAGVDSRRSVPRFATKTWRQIAPPPGTGRPVVVFVDSFTDHFAPDVAAAAHQVLVRAGYAPTISDEAACCALTWLSTGQLDAARRRLTRTVALLAPAARKGIRIVGLEPSCTAALRHDAVELLDSEDARLVAGSVRTLAELLSETPDWTPPDLSGMAIVAQPHCHHHAILGWQTDADLLETTGATVTRLGGCCGLAGNFGVERGHHETSVAVAELQLMPALDAAPDAVVLADGFSCRTQVADLAERRSMHLAQLLDHAEESRSEFTVD